MTVENSHYFWGRVSVQNCDPHLVKQEMGLSLKERAKNMQNNAKNQLNRTPLLLDALNTFSVKDLQNQSRKGQGIEKLKGFIVVLYAAKSGIFGIFGEGFVQ